MIAHNLLPDFHHLLDHTGDEEAAAGRIFSFSPRGVLPDGETVGGSCSTLLAAVLTFGRYQLSVTATPVAVTRYAERSGTFARAGALALAGSEGETFTLAQIFGSEAHAQAVVDEAWQTIHQGTAAAVLTKPSL